MNPSEIRIDKYHGKEAQRLEVTGRYAVSLFSIIIIIVVFAMTQSVRFTRKLPVIFLSKRLSITRCVYGVKGGGFFFSFRRVLSLLRRIKYDFKSKSNAFRSQ